ncbi:MAG: CocE/NonD family hydrolase [Gemmatimonadetes bacterium]|nr:CocE/NonD family hydrolase [Gemmatimonadota bacterium]
MRHLVALGLLWSVAPRALHAQPVDSTWLRAHYRKVEARIPMRDGVRLFTSIYVPRDTAGQRFPILLTRTPFSAGPYGPDAYRRALGPSNNPRYARDGFIFVIQDVRGRWMSEGELVMMTPHRRVKQAGETDESTDATDTITWLLANVAPNNGKVGIYGFSWPGFYTTASCIDAPSAVVACSPQAPVTDLWMGDDGFHNGAMMLVANFFGFAGLSRPRRAGPGPNDFHAIDLGPDAYAAYLALGPIGPAARRLIHPDSGWLWYAAAAHLTYDAYNQARDISRHVGGIHAPTLVVGGWFDAEDLAGPWRTWRALRAKAPATDARLVVGPWEHVAWARGDANTVGPLTFGPPSGPFYRDSIEFPFFRFHLKGGEAPRQPRVMAYETGANAWRSYETFPPPQAERRALYLAPGGRLAFTPPAPARTAYDAYVSDPAHPVPTTDRIEAEGAPSDWMVADQRYASRRPDVLTYVSDVLARDVVLAGPVTPVLHVATTGGDADFIVKLIDVQPDADSASTITGAAPLAQVLIRGEPFRGRYRRSFEKPVPFTPGVPDSIRFEMPDVNHRFRKGHRIMVQVQSSWFPLVDRNPQTWVPDILEARPEQFRAQEMRVYRSGARATRLEVFVLP